MKKLLLIIVLLLSTNQIFSQYKGDKLLHFKAGVAVGAVGYSIAKVFKADNKTAKLVGTLLALGVGYFKENSDRNNGATFDYGDWLSTGAGGFTITVSLNKLQKSKRKYIFK